MIGLHHYKTKRESVRLLAFWSNRLSDKQLEANMSEVLTRADILLDGLEMLTPTNTQAQERLLREAIIYVKKAVMVAHGAFVCEERQK
jgi:hypothetical protein